MEEAMSDPNLKRSLGIAFMTQNAELVINFISVMILARIITSEQIGIYSVAAFLMTLLHVFRDFGVAKYVIQEPELTREKMRSVLGVAILLAWAVALVLFLLRTPVANFYHEPRLENILAVMSLSFAATPVGSILNAIYRRNMQLKKVAAVRIGSALAGTVTGVSMGMLGFGAISLAWANLATIVAFGVIAALLRQGQIPLMPNFRNMREIVRFGSIASMGTLANSAGNNCGDVIIGKMLSLEATGYFSRGNGLVQIFKTIVSQGLLPLVLPYFAALRRESSDMIGPYQSAITYLTGFAWPFFGVLSVLALPVVRTLYGPNWDVSVPLVQILCAAGAVSMLTVFAGDVMIANGHVKEVTQLQLLTQPVRIMAILAASMLNLSAVTWAMVGAEAVALAVVSRLLYRTAGVTLSGVLAASSKSALVTFGAVAGPGLLMLAGGAGHPWLDTLIGGLAAIAGWVAAVFWTNHPIHTHLSQAKTWLQAKFKQVFFREVKGVSN
jgi:O-antigen/teichoic acid export membrane protein